MQSKISNLVVVQYYFDLKSTSNPKIEQHLPLRN